MGYYHRILSHKYTRENSKVTDTRLQETITDQHDYKKRCHLSPNSMASEGDSNRACSDWHALAASSLTDLDVDDLDQALFLFALRKVQKAPAADLSGVWKRYAPYWKRRLLPEAFRIVAEVYSRACSGVDAEESR